MASNSLPAPQNRLWTLAADMSDGLEKNPTVPVVQNTQAKLDADLAAAKLTQGLYEKAQKAEDDAMTARNIANSNGKAALALTKRQLGDVPGALAKIWTGGGTGIPDNIPDRINLLEKTADYLKDNPAEEVDKKGFTQTQIRAVFDALTAGRNGLKNATGPRVDAKAARDTADSALRSRMSALTQELAQPGLLTADDDRWYAFGLVPPAGVERPGIAPDDVHLRKIAPGTVIAGWSATPRAQNYRPFIQVVGRDADFIGQPLTSELDLTLENLPLTGTLKFYVQATNPAGDSPKSAVVEVNLG